MKKEKSSLETLKEIEQHSFGAYKDLSKQIATIRTALENFENLQKLFYIQGLVGKGLRKKADTLKIIKEKKVDVWSFMNWLECKHNNYEDYLKEQSDYAFPISESDLSKTEFEMLKEELK